MNEIICNNKIKDFSKRDIKKSDFLVKIDKYEKGVVSLSEYDNKNNTYIKLIDKEFDEENKEVILEKELFHNFKEKYLIKIQDDNKHSQVYIIEFKKNKMLIPIFAFLSILLIGVALLFFNKDNIDIPDVPGIIDSNGQKGNGEFDSENVQDYLDSQTKYLNVNISSNIKVSNGKGYFKIYNSNEDMDIQVIFHPYNPLTKEIDYDTNYYVSPLLHYNENVGYDKFSYKLEKGEHNAVAVFNAFDKDSQEFLGSFGQEVIIDVE